MSFHSVVLFFRHRAIDLKLKQSLIIIKHYTNLIVECVFHKEDVALPQKKMLQNKLKQVSPNTRGILSAQTSIYMNGGNVWPQMVVTCWPSLTVDKNDHWM